MKTKLVQRAIVAAALLAGGGVYAAETDVQRQLQMREQQQMELRLKMQQQLDRASTPPQTPGSTGLQLRQLERDQQQRLQIQNDQAIRSGVAPAAAVAAQRELERNRAAKAANEELQRMEAERRMQQQRQ